MNQTAGELTDPKRLDSGLRALCGIAGYYRIAADPITLERELGLGDQSADEGSLVRAAAMIGLKARLIRRCDPKRLQTVPVPAIARMKAGNFVVYGGQIAQSRFRLVDPITRREQALSLDDLVEAIDGTIVLVARKIGGTGADPQTFGFRRFLPSIWRYRRPLGQVLIASLFVQLFALVTPLFFQVVIDKVLAHKGYSTLLVLVSGILIIGLFDVVLQYLRTFALSHTTNRIDVELGQRLFQHLVKLPLAYFETRGAGQTVARMRELETIRSFLTGQGLFAAIDFVFTFVFIAVLTAYSWRLTLIVVATIPLYLLIAGLIRPLLRLRIKERFNRGAENQQFLVETVVGIQTIKASAVEPVVQAQWEEKLARYVHTTFGGTLLSAGGQSGIQYISKASNALLLLFGAKAVIDGDLTVGGLIAFNMIAAQVAQPVLRLSQIWQDFQQVQISIERLGDILNVPAETGSLASVVMPPPKGLIEIRHVTFRYRPGGPEILKNLSVTVNPGQVVGIVGPSGSGKSTVTKLIQRLYRPDEGQVFLDGNDLAHCDPGWLRRNIGVVLQENILFNRSIHDNIAFANPGMNRSQVIRVARLAGADQFITSLPQGYDTVVEERGANLSGGQRQRIAIARALATDPPILIFDEATSALDYESERVIQRNMREIIRNRTVVIIAHRLAAVRHCDRIIGMRDGRIVEFGTHAELMADGNGLYASLWAIQNEQIEAAS